MLNRNIDLQNGSFSFSDYFKMNIEIDELLNEFGYVFKKDFIFKEIEPFSNIDILKNDLNFILNSLEFNNEIGIREFIISPILIFMLKHAKFKLKSEKNLYFNNQLKGTIDYYIENKNFFAIIEAKYHDLNNGFKQLSTELIALDNLIINKDNEIFGAVTIGTDWIFAKVNRDKKEIIKDLKIIRVPEELDKLIGILNYIVRNE